MMCRTAGTDGRVHPTTYHDLNHVLHELVRSAKAVLGGNHVGAYLQGSFAIGGFDVHSDCDFVVVIAEELSGSEIEGLQAMHDRVFSMPSRWAQHLEGSYFPQEILRDYSRSGTPLWYLDNGSRSLIQSEHDNSVVVRWTLRGHGVTLAGPGPASLVDPIPVSALRREIVEVALGWGGQILREPERIGNCFYQGFAVLSYCRMLHDLHNGCCGSKRAGAEWAKSRLAPSWSGLIDRAWDCRPHPEVSVKQAADPADVERTLAFIRHVMTACEEWGPAAPDTGSA